MSSAFAMSFCFTLLFATIISSTFCWCKVSVAETGRPGLLRSRTCFFRVFSSIKSRPLLNFTFSKTSITVYSFHSLVDDNCRTSFCSKKLNIRALFHKVVISRRRHFLTDRDRCTHIATSLFVNGNDVTQI